MPAHPSPSRLEAFSDGVIAVIITIMVLDFKVPHADGLAAFTTMAPTFGVYLLSFIFTGIYWINHHHLTNRLKRVDTLILWANLSFLFTLSLLPFFTNYLVEKGVTSLPVSLYAATLSLDAITFTFLTTAILHHIHHAGALYDATEARDQLAEQQKGGASLALYLAAMPIAFWHPWIALILICCSTLVWIVPTFGLKPQSTGSPPVP